MGQKTRPILWADPLSCCGHTSNLHCRSDSTLALLCSAPVHCQCSCYHVILIAGVRGRYHHPGEPVQAGGELTKLSLPVPTRCIAVLLAMVPPPPPPQLVGKEDDIHFFTNAKSSPAVLAHSICRALKDHALLDWPLPAGRAGG